MFLINVKLNGGKMKTFLKIAAAALAVAAASAGAFASDVRKAAEKASREGLRVYEVSRKVETVGNVRATTVELMFENTTDRTMESEFEFPLDDGESVTGYALDINGKMRRGVVVEKDKGRQAFEEIVRRGVDPGLVEMTAGNNFRTRVYPITPRGVRHLEITVERELTGAEAKAQSGKVYTQTVGKDTYFYCYAEAPQIPQAERPKAARLVVWWDSSASGARRDVESEIALLEQHVASMESPRVLVVPFSETIRGARMFEGNSKTALRKLSEYIRSIEYDGATNLSLDFGSLGGDEALVFSDGLGNWDDAKKPTKKERAELLKGADGFGGGTPTVGAVTSALSADFSRLRKIARAGGGQFVNVRQLGVDGAEKALAERPLRLVRAECDGKAVSALLPADGETVPGDGISVAGILKKKKAKIRLVFGRGNEASEAVEIEVSAVGSEDSERIQRLWAKKRIDSLSEDYDANRTEIIELSKRHGIVTKETSLIVLENVSDYVRYGIEPPEELREEYERLAGRMNRTKPQDGGGIPASVYRLFEEFREWWRKSPSDWKREAEKKEAAKREAEKRRLEQRTRGRPVNDTMILMDAAETAPAAAAAPVARLDDRKMAGGARMMKGEAAPSPRAAPRKPTASSRASAAAFDEMVEEAEALAETAAGPADGSAAPANEAAPERGASVSLRAWESGAPYLAALKKTETEKMYAKYLDLRKEWGGSPAFYMEVSDYFAEEGLERESVRILSNLAEMNLEDTDVLRALGYKLVERGLPSLAVRVFERLARLRPEVPQFHRDLAMAARDAGDAQTAVDHLWLVASRDWDGRYHGIQQTALNDMNSIIARTGRRKIDTARIDSKLMENFDCDVRVVLTWNTDDCDIDLWVTDPSGEKCFYGHKYTAQGGRMSRDFTQGYGPEEFCLRSAERGKYKIEANYFGTRKQSMLQPVTVQAEVYTNFGRADEKRQVLTLQLKEVRGTFLVGEVEL